MGMNDNQLYFSDAQALTASAVATNVIDTGAPSMIGSGERLRCGLSLLGVAPGGTLPTLTATLWGADDAAMSVNRVAIGAVTPTLVSGTALTDPCIEIGVAIRVRKRYYRVEYVLGGTNPTMTVSSWLAEELQTNPKLLGT